MDSHLVVIIPTFRAGGLLADAIISVRKASKLSRFPVKIITVDNSTDSSDRIYSTEADIYHPMPSNPGFGAAVNKGLEIAYQKYDFEWVLLLNPDAKLGEDFFAIFSKKIPDSLGDSSNPVMPLICFDHPILRVKASILKENNIESITFLDPHDQFLVFTDKGKPIDFNDHYQKTLTKGNILCIRTDEEFSNQLIYSRISPLGAEPILTYESLELDSESFIKDFLVQNAGSEIHSPYSAGDLLTGYLASSVKSYFGGPRRAWCGAGVLLPRSYIDAIGRFDSSFFLYYEDTELSYRAISLDCLPILLPELQVFHRHSAIANQNLSLRTKSIWQSRALFVARTSGLGHAALLSLGIIARAAISLIRKQTTFKHTIRFILPEFYNTLVGTANSIYKRSGL